MWLEQSEKRGSVGGERDKQLLHLPVCFLLFFFSHFMFCLFHLLIYQQPFLSLPAHIHLPPTHRPLMCLPHFLSACLPVDQAAGGYVDTGTTKASSPGCLEAAMLSASVLDDCRITPAWRDTDNNLQVRMKQGRGWAECENCGQLAVDMYRLKNMKNSQTDNPITHTMFLCHRVLQMLSTGLSKPTQLSCHRSAYPLSKGAGSHAANGCFATGTSWE